MSVENHAPVQSRAMTITGAILSGLTGAFLIFGGISDICKFKFAVEGAASMGYSENVLVPLGAALTAAAVLYLIPQTAVLGAILITGYLGGAVSTHVRVTPHGLQFLFPVIFATFVWMGIFLRERRLRALLPFRAPR